VGNAAPVRVPAPRDTAVQLKGKIIGCVFTVIIQDLLTSAKVVWLRD
jgi:hypothetical protein